MTISPGPTTIRNVSRSRIPLDFTTRPRTGITSSSTPAADMLSVLFVIAFPPFFSFVCAAEADTAYSLTDVCDSADARRHPAHRQKPERKIPRRVAKSIGFEGEGNCRLHPRVHHRIKRVEEARARRQRRVPLPDHNRLFHDL